MKDASSSTSAKRAPNPFLIALFLGLAAGLTEVALLGVKKFALHHYPIGRSAHTVWESPASLALVLLVVAVPFWAISRTHRRDQVLIVGMGVLAYLAALDVLFLASRLHWASRVLLAAGLATTFVVTSDHGEEFGEHGLISHGHSLYLQSLRAADHRVGAGCAGRSSRFAMYFAPRSARGDTRFGRCTSVRAPEVFGSLLENCECELRTH